MYKYYYFFGSPNFEFKVSSKSIQHMQMVCSILMVQYMKLTLFINL